MEVSYGAIRLSSVRLECRRQQTSRNYRVGMDVRARLAKAGAGLVCLAGHLLFWVFPEAYQLFLSSRLSRYVQSMYVQSVFHTVQTVQSPPSSVRSVLMCCASLDYEYHFLVDYVHNCSLRRIEDATRYRYSRYSARIRRRFRENAREIGPSAFSSSLFRGLGLYILRKFDICVC